MSGTALPLVEPAMTQSPLNQASSQATAATATAIGAAVMTILGDIIFRVYGTALSANDIGAGVFLIGILIHPLYVRWMKMPAKQTAGVITPAVVARPVDPAPIPPKASLPAPAPVVAPPVPAPPQPPKVPV